MTDYSELKRLAEIMVRDIDGDLSDTEARNFHQHVTDYEAMTQPADILALIAESERLKGDVVPGDLLDDAIRLETERDALKSLLHKFVDGEQDVDENQAERHMYFTDAQSLLAMIDGEIEEHTIVPDSALKAMHDERNQLKTENAGFKTGYEAYEQVNAELKAEVEVLRATVDLQKLLPEISDALEELELHGLHSDQGYRKLRDWYRKVGLAYRVIQGPMFGAEHGELVSQNTWLRSVVEHYAQQHAPLEPIPDSDGWSTRLPGYDLPTLLRDAERYRWLRSQHWNESDMAVVCHPKKSVKLGFDCPSGERLDHAIDAAMGKGEQV